MTLAVLGCTSSPSHLCTPGASVACVGAGGCSGGQVCNAEGSGFGACDCLGGVDSGVGDAGAGDAGATDANLDAGPVACDPLTSTPCGTGERCAWVREAAGGHLDCVADGTVASGGACTIGTDGSTGPDDCARGLFCLGGACVAVCDSTLATSCAPSGSCQLYSDTLSATVGVCQPRCNPLTQLLTDGSSCPSGQGCYEEPGASGGAPHFVCAHAGTAPIGPYTGTPFVNSCVPGAHLLRAPNGTDFECVPYCTPVTTSSTAPAGLNGMSPHSCVDQGGNATDECLFNWFLGGVDPSNNIQNEIGTCFDVVGRTYDDDMNTATPEVPYPSCTTQPTTDTDSDGVPQNQQWGCAPSP